MCACVGFSLKDRVRKDAGCRKTRRKTTMDRVVEATFLVVFNS